MQSKNVCGIGKSNKETVAFCKKTAFCHVFEPKEAAMKMDVVLENRGAFASHARIGKIAPVQRKLRGRIPHSVFLVVTLFSLCRTVCCFSHNPHGGT